MYVFTVTIFVPRHKKIVFAYAKTKTQITAKLISAIVFAIRIVQSLYFLNSKFQASSHIVWLYSPVYVGPGWKPRRPVFSERSSFKLLLQDKSSHKQANIDLILTTHTVGRSACTFALSPQNICYSLKSKMRKE